MYSAIELYLQAIKQQAETDDQFSMYLMDCINRADWSMVGWILHQAAIKGAQHKTNWIKADIKKHREMYYSTRKGHHNHEASIFVKALDKYADEFAKLGIELNRECD